MPLTIFFMKCLRIFLHGGNGMVTSIGYLRLSYVNSIRQSPEVPVLIGRVNASILENMVFSAIPPAIPGQQSVTCTNTMRSPFDIERRLDRFECVIVTRGGRTDKEAGAAVAQTAATFLDVAFPGLYTNFQTSSIGFCGSDETVFNNVILEWPETEAGGTISIPCPAASGQVTRKCVSDMMWNSPNVSLCTLAINIIDYVLSKTITLDNYEELSRRVAVALMFARNDSSQQTDTLIELVSWYFDIMLALVKADPAIGMNRSYLITYPVVQSLSASVAAIQQWPANAFATNGYSSSVVRSLESVISLYAQLLGINETAVIIEDNFVLVAENALVSELAQNGRTVSFENDNFPSPIGSTRLADNQVASIALPPSLFGRITDRLQVGVFFALYTENTLFPVRGQPTSISNGATSSSNTVVGSPVVASTVGPSLSFTNLENPVQINLRLMGIEDSIILPGSETCVSWDFDGAGGDGNWSTEGCTTYITCDNVIRCNCTHLTNFAVLVDICSRVNPDECRTSESFDTALSVITIIGVVLSMLGLILTVTTLLVFKRLRNRDATIFHIQLCTAVFLMLLVFVSGIEQVSRVGGCMLVSVLLHYFTLASFFWMTAEALLMFQKLVLVFRKVTKQSIIITSLVSWLAPLIFLVPPLITDLVNGEDPANDLIIDRNHFCFLSNRFVFGFTFLLPLLLLFVFNCIVLTVVVVILVRHTKGSLARKKEAMGTKTVARLAVSITGIIFLFGISWLFAALTITVPAIRLPAQVLFAIFNSLQGFFIFIFFCVLSEEARESWKELLSCGKYKSSYLNPSLKWGKYSKAERADKTKNSTSIFKGTSSTGLDSGKSEDTSNYYSESEGNRKVELSKAEEPNNYSIADPEYSTVPEPKKKDLSGDDDKTPNVYAAVVQPNEPEAEVHVYTKDATDNSSSKASITAVELQAKNNTFFTAPNASVVETAIDENN